MKPFILGWLVFILFLSLVGAAPADAEADAILGVWHTTGNKSQVKIFKRNDHFFAQILSVTWPNWPADDKFGMGGKPRTDRNNPNPELRNHPLAGLEIMSDLVYAGKNVWEDGKIYDPESGKTYKCTVKLTPDHHLEVHGYVGFAFIGRTVVWTR